MPQKILEELLLKLTEAGNTPPALLSQLMELTALNGGLLAREEVSAGELAKLKEACAELQASIADLTSNPGAAPAGFRQLIPALKAVQAPLACYLRNLNGNPKNLKEAAADTAWLDSYFGLPAAVEDDPDYDPDSLSFDGVPFPDILDRSRREAAAARDGFRQHLERLSGDPEEPEAVLREKLGVIRTLLPAGAAGRPDFAAAARDAYARAAAALDPSRITTLDPAKGGLPGARFYTVTLPQLFDCPKSVSEIEAMPGLDPATRARLLEAAKRLRMQRNWLGIDNVRLDALTKTGNILGVCERCRIFVLEFNVGAEENPKHRLCPVLTAIRRMNDAVLASLRGDPGAKAPSSAQVQGMASLVRDYVEEQDILGEDGLLRAEIPALGKMVTELASYYPEVQEAAERITGIVRRKGLDACDAMAETAAKARSPRKAGFLEKALQSLTHGGVITKEYAEASRLTRAALDHAAGAAENERAMKLLRSAGPQLMLRLHTEERDRFQRDLVLVMFRNRAFRNACIGDAKDRIAAVFGGTDRITAEAWAQLGSKEKFSLEQDVLLLTAANGVSAALKNVKAEQILTENLSFDEASKVRAYASKLLSRQEALAAYRSDPAAVLIQLAGRNAPASGGIAKPGPEAGI